MGIWSHIDKELQPIYGHLAAPPFCSSTSAAPNRRSLQKKIDSEPQALFLARFPIAGVPFFDDVPRVSESPAGMKSDECFGPSPPAASAGRTSLLPPPGISSV